MCFSRSSSFGVVPLEMSAWNPEMAPQAMVMQTNGKTGPVNTRPSPFTKDVTAGICRVGMTMMMATPSTATVPIFMNVLR